MSRASYYAHQAHRTTLFEETSPMTPLLTVATAPTTRCPQCAFHHDGAAGSLCATCAAKTAAGPLLVIKQREDWAVHAAHLHFPTPSTIPETHDAPPEATEEPVPQKDSTPEPPARPAPARPRRPSRQPLPPQVCAYEPCGRLFTPRKAGQRFHSLSCSARWRVSQDAGKAQLRRAAALPKPRTRPPASASFAAQVRAELTALATSAIALRTHLEAQHAVLDRHERQAECLRRYLALTEEP